MELSREAAWQLLTEYTQSPSLLRHGMAVEACMRWYASKYGEDEERWGITGLLHDLDWERWPTYEDHPLKGAAILAERGYPEDIIRAIKSHADYLDVPRVTLMEKTLYAVDELSGFVTAVALVRDSKSIFDVQVSSVKKKMKDKAFAKAVSREDIKRGAEDLGLSLDEHIANVIEALKEAAERLDLVGQGVVATGDVTGDVGAPGLKPQVAAGLKE